MTDTGATTDDLLRRAKAGDTAALGALFAHYRDRLRTMVRLRLDRRVAGRLDPSDVLQEAYLDVAHRFAEYAAAPAVAEAVSAVSEPRCCAACGEGVMLLVGLLPRGRRVVAGLCGDENSS